MTEEIANLLWLFKPDSSFSLVLAGKDFGKPTELKITVLDETQEIGGVLTRVVEERETVGGKLAEVSRNFCILGVATKNLYYFGEDVDVYRGDKVVHEGAWRAGTSGAKHGVLRCIPKLSVIVAQPSSAASSNGVSPPGRVRAGRSANSQARRPRYRQPVDALGVLLPGTVKIADRYYQEKAPGVAMDRAENVATNQTVRVPAGAFKNCLKVKETTPLESGTEYKYYAPGVGLLQDGKLKLVNHGFVKK